MPHSVIVIDARSRQISHPTKEFLRRILDRNVNSRLGSLGDAAEVKAMEFLSALDFDKVLNKEYEPEFRPPATGTDVATASNFDTEFTSEKVRAYVR